MIVYLFEYIFWHQNGGLGLSKTEHVDYSGESGYEHIADYSSQLSNRNRVK
jgi:hypothetical protein